VFFWVGWVEYDFLEIWNIMCEVMVGVLVCVDFMLLDVVVVGIMN